MANLRHTKKDTTTIVVGVGLGNIEFGASREEVLKYFGKPDHIETVKGSDGLDILFENWIFEELKLDLVFFPEDVDRVGSFELAHPDSILHDIKLIGESQGHTMMIMRKLGFDLSSPEEDKFGDSSLVFLDRESLT